MILGIHPRDRDDIFKTTSDGNGNINATLQVFQ